VQFITADFTGKIGDAFWATDKRVELTDAQSRKT